MSPPRRFLRDPLLHFLAAGAVVFAAYYLIAGSPEPVADDRTIVVDKAKLLTYLQYESRTFKPKFFDARFDAMPDQRKKELIDQYVPEEALYREARAMGLEQGDYVIRRRLVQKMLYLIDDTATESFAPTQQQLRAYYLKHVDRYKIAPSLTFTQVFVDAEIERDHSAEELARDLREKLQKKGAGFNDAPAYGDRFPYQQNYVDRDPDYISHLFGAAFTDALMQLAPSDHVWYGPIKSQFGYHLVLVTRHVQARVPALAEVRAQVQDDLLRDTVSSYRDRAVADLVSRYKVKLDGIRLQGK